MEKLISIIMGAYNCESTVEDAVESIVNQKYKNWELIICDDASKDKTLEIIKKYQEKDKRIIVIHNDNNQGLAASLNNCIEVSKGEYIARMDTDDVCIDNRLLKEYEFLELNKEYDVCGAAAYIFDENGVYGIRCPKEKPCKEDLINGAPFLHPTVLIRADVLKGLNGYIANKNTKRAEDLNLWFRFYSAGHKGYNIQEPLYRYREGLSDYKKRTFKAAIGTYKVFLDGYKMIGVKGIKKLYALRPVISALIPNKIMFKRHKSQLKPIETEGK